MHTPALQAASIEGHEQIAKLLLDHGADVGWTLCCCSSGVPTSTRKIGCREGARGRLMLDGGKAEADSKDSEGRTPLLWAAWRRQDGVVRLLFNSGRSRPT